MSKCKKYFTFDQLLNNLTMKSRYLFAHKYKPLGWFLFLIGIALGIIYTAGGEELMKIEMKVFPLYKV